LISLITIAHVIGGYALGSIPFGLVLAKRRGVDVRSVGSGNIGATNVARSVGKGIGAAVLVLDAAKGAAPIISLSIFAPELLNDTLAMVLVGLSPVLGHCFPVWLRFRGGKGVATALGVFAVVCPAALALGAVLWIGLYGFTRVASIGSIATAFAVPALAYLLESPVAACWLAAAICLLVLVRHAGNIRRLWRREEFKV